MTIKYGNIKKEKKIRVFKIELYRTHVKDSKLLVATL